MKDPEMGELVPEAREAVQEVAALIWEMSHLEEDGQPAGHLTTLRMMPDLALKMERALTLMRNLPGVVEALEGRPPKLERFTYMGKAGSVIPRWESALRLALSRVIRTHSQGPEKVAISATFVREILGVENLTPAETRRVNAWMRASGWVSITRLYRGSERELWVRRGTRNPTLVWVNARESFPFQP